MLPLSPPHRWAECRNRASASPLIVQLPLLRHRVDLLSNLSNHRLMPPKSKTAATAVPDPVEAAGCGIQWRLDSCHHCLPSLPRRISPSSYLVALIWACSSRSLYRVLSRRFLHITSLLHPSSSMCGGCGRQDELVADPGRRASIRSGHVWPRCVVCHGMNSWESCPAQTFDAERPHNLAIFFSLKKICFLNAYKVFDENPRRQRGSIICGSHVIYNQLQSHVDADSTEEGTTLTSALVVGAEIAKTREDCCPGPELMSLFMISPSSAPLQERRQYFGSVCSGMKMVKLFESLLQISQVALVVLLLAALSLDGHDRAEWGIVSTISLENKKIKRTANALSPSSTMPLHHQRMTDPTAGAQIRSSSIGSAASENAPRMRSTVTLQPMTCCTTMDSGRFTTARESAELFF